jgi:hypothetical protein
VQRHHLGRRMDPQHHRQAPALRTPEFHQTSEFRLIVLGLIGPNVLD